MIYSLAEFLQRSFRYGTTIVVQRSGSKPAGLLIVLLQSMMMVFTFGFMMWFLGRFGGQSIRGNFAVYVLSGVGMFLMHNKIMGALSGATASADLRKFAVSPSMAVLSNFSADFFLQSTVIFILIAGIFAWYGPVPIDNFPLVVGVIVLLVLWSVGVGLIFMGLMPLLGPMGQIIRMLYMRLGMITSGKFLVANQTPAPLYDLYSWNPLFHLIDQMRGAVFVNYIPFKTSLAYPAKMIIIFMIIGMYLEFMGRRKYGVTVSESA